MSEQNNPWKQAKKKSGKPASGAKKSGAKGQKSDYQPAYKSGSKHSGGKRYEKPYQPGKNNIIVPAVEKPIPKAKGNIPKLKGEATQTKQTHRLIDGKIVDLCETVAYEITPLSNPADETVPIK
ncbi:MAG: hypothetical protein ABG776_09180, partial [Cyanobacteria bacterium J06555_13]